jgi:hypothetical protein
LTNTIVRSLASGTNGNGIDQQRHKLDCVNTGLSGPFRAKTRAVAWTNNGTSWTGGTDVCFCRLNLFAGTLRRGLTTAQAGLFAGTCRFGHESLCRDYWRRRVSLDQQRHKLDCRQYGIDESFFRLCFCRFGHESLCRDLWRCVSLDQQRHKLDCRDEYGFDETLSTNNGTSWTAVNRVSTSVLLPFRARISLPGLWRWRVSLDQQRHKLDCRQYVFGLTNLDEQRSILPYGVDESALAVSGTNLFAGTFGGGVFLSTNNGTSWTAVNTGLTNLYVFALAVSGTNLFAGTYYGGVFRSTNNGTSWTTVNSGLYVICSCRFGHESLCRDLWRWRVSLDQQRHKLDCRQYGLDESLASMPLAVSGTNLFAGIIGGVFLSTNNGTSWTAVNTGLTNLSVTALAVSGTNLFAGTYGGSVWRRPLSEMTAVENLPNEVPAEFVLEQNYPNPFNPATRIPFAVRGSGFVSLKVYDVLGREVRTLVNENLPPGSYEVTFDARDWPAGFTSTDLRRESSQRQGG